MTGNIFPLTWLVFVGLCVITFGGVFLVTWTARCVLYQLSLDIIEIVSRYTQMKLDFRQQALELDFKSEEAQAKLEDWRATAHLRLQAQRLRLVVGDGGDND